MQNMAVALLAAVWMCVTYSFTSGSSSPGFACAADNDLYRLLTDGGLTCPRYDTPEHRAWCIETGWVQGWVVTTLALRQMNTTLWDLTSNRPLEVQLEKNLKLLLPEGS